MEKGTISAVLKTAWGFSYTRVRQVGKQPSNSWNWSHLATLNHPAPRVAGRQCWAAVLHKPALPSLLQLGDSQQKFMGLIREKYVRTSTEMKSCWVGVGLKLVFGAQDFVERAEGEGCRQVTTCMVSPVWYLHSRNCLQQKKICRLRFTAKAITSTTHQMSWDNWDRAANKDCY